MPDPDDLTSFFPGMGSGVVGLKPGSTAPLFILFFALVRGISAGLFLKAAKKQIKPTNGRTGQT